jgi:hypothetical protein
VAERPGSPRFFRLSRVSSPVARGGVMPGWPDGAAGAPVSRWPAPGASASP